MKQLMEEQRLRFSSISEVDSENPYAKEAGPELEDKKEETYINQYGVRVRKSQLNRQGSEDDEVTFSTNKG